MTDENPWPLLPIERGRITTLVGAPGLELAALTCALAVSYHSGVEVVPGWGLDGPGDVIIASYSSDWATWRGLMAEVCDVAGVADPSIHIQCHDAPLGQESKLVERDPDAKPFWDRALEADVEAESAAAKAIGRQLAPPLAVVFGYGMSPASGFGADLRSLYDRLQGTALVVDAEGAFTGPSAPWTWVGTRGPIVRLSDLIDNVTGLSAFLERICARYVIVPVESEPESPAAANGAHGRGCDVNGFLAESGIDAVRQLSTDGRSSASQALKAEARRRGLGPGALWKVADRFARDVTRRTGRLAGRGPGTLYGYAAVFDQWREVDSLLEGHYLQRIAPGAFTRTIATERHRMKVVFRHGKDDRVSYQSLGSISLLEEDAHGLRYEVDLLDADHTWELAPWLATGKYGGSLTFEVQLDRFVRNPGTSAHNPRGLPEHTVLEMRVQEFGPASPPAFAGTSAGIRQ